MLWCPRLRPGEEGLLKHDLYPGIPGSMIPANSPHVSPLREPFVVDLSSGSFKLTHVTLQPDASSFKMHFRLGHKLKRGSSRAVVHLEEYPSAYLRKRGRRADPLLAMRVLEMVDPTERFSAEGYSLLVEPGELVMERDRPWGFSPDHDSPNRKIVEDWLRTQSASSGPSQRP